MATKLNSTQKIGSHELALQVHKGVSVIVSVYNQVDYIKTLHNTLYEILVTYGHPFEILYIDDGSTDGSWKELENLKQDKVRLLKLRTSFGEAAVLDAGLKSSYGDNILYLTCRVRVNPHDLIKLLKQLDQGYDLVIGQRYPRRDSKLNQIVSTVFNGITNRFTKLNLHDINSGVMAMKRKVLESVPFYGSLNAFIPVLAQRQGFKITEEEIEQLGGEFNQSLYPKDYIRRFLDLISVLFLRNYTKKPLHFLGFIGAIFAIVGAFIDIYLFIYRILGIGGIAGKPMLLLGTLFFIIGIQMISIGLLGEMIIFTHAKDIKDYNIEEIID